MKYILSIILFFTCILAFSQDSTATVITDISVTNNAGQVTYTVTETNTVTGVVTVKNYTSLTTVNDLKAQLQDEYDQISEQIPLLQERRASILERMQNDQARRAAILDQINNLKERRRELREIYLSL